MPSRTLQILNGPHFRKFVLENGIVTETSWDMTFTMNKEIPGQHCLSIHADKHLFQMKLMMVGRKLGVHDVNIFSFIGRIVGSTIATRATFEQEEWFYVGTYDTRTRTGTCIEFPKDEFLKIPLMEELLSKKRG